MPGSNAAPPHSAPPSNPGKTIVPSNDGGANMPDFSFRNRSSTAACASGVRRVSIASVRPWRANGGGFSRPRLRFGEPLAVDRRRRHRRSSIGKSDAPVRRSSTKTSPNLVICATASTWRVRRA